MRAVIVRYGIKEFVRNIWFDLFIILQLLLVFIVSIFAASSVTLSMKYYNTFSDVLEGDGYSIQPMNEFGGFFLNSDSIEDTDYFSDYSEYFGRISAMRQLNAYGTDSDENPYPQYTYAYNGALIYKYKPLMRSGKWLSEVKVEQGVVHAVVSPNAYGLTIGDRIEQRFYTYDGDSVILTVEIVGIFRDGAKLFGIYSHDGENTVTTDSQSNSVEGLFHNYYVSSFNLPAFVYNIEELEAYNVNSIIEQRILVPFKKGLTDSEISQAKQDLVKFGVGEISFEDIRKDTLSDVRKQLIILVPVIIGLMVLTVISILSLTAISTHKQLKNYGILYLCGGRWRQCALINLVVIVIDILLSGCMTYIVMQLLNISGKLQNTVVVFGREEAAVCGLIVLISLFVSMVMPFTIIGSTQPREILKAEE